jgi:hypothetical protein
MGLELQEKQPVRQLNENGTGGTEDHDGQVPNWEQKEH